MTDVYLVWEHNGYSWELGATKIVKAYFESEKAEKNVKKFNDIEAPKIEKVLRSSWNPDCGEFNGEGVPCRYIQNIEVE